MGPPENKIHVLSRSDRPFQNRKEAGELLGEALMKYQNTRAVVLGIPRGGVAVAFEVAKALHAQLDVVLVHKLGSRENPEYAIAAINESGELFVEKHAAASARKFLEAARGRMLDQIRQRSLHYRRIRPRAALKGKSVIVVDDGMATGATMRAALLSLQKEGPERLVAAIPAAPESSLAALAEMADEVICLSAPEIFWAVGQMYRDFDQVGDEQVAFWLGQGTGFGAGENAHD